MNLMMMLLLMAGVGALLGGVVAILFGIPVKEFSFGNTLIVVGAMAACTGLIMVLQAAIAPTTIRVLPKHPDCRRRNGGLHWLDHDRVVGGGRRIEVDCA